jgi:hypothetical protein
MLWLVAQPMRRIPFSKWDKNEYYKLLYYLQGYNLKWVMEMNGLQYNSSLEGLSLPSSFSKWARKIFAEGR